MAKKTLRDRLIEGSERKDVQEAVKHFATFLKLWEEISEAYKEGWSYKEIWRALDRDGQIDFSYSSFLNFTRKLKRRQLECEKEKARRTGGATTTATASKAMAQPPTLKPGATRVDLPQFGQEVKPRDPKRF